MTRDEKPETHGPNPRANSGDQPRSVLLAGIVQENRVIQTTVQVAICEWPSTLHVPCGVPQQDAAVANPVLANADVVAFADSTKSSCACEAFWSDIGKPKTCFPTFENMFRHNRKHATRAKKTGSIQKNCRAAIFCAPCNYLSRCIFSTY